MQIENSAKDRFFIELKRTDCNWWADDNEFYNEYTKNQSLEYENHLNSLYIDFCTEVENNLPIIPNSEFYLNILKNKIEEIHQFINKWIVVEYFNYEATNEILDPNYTGIYGSGIPQIIQQKRSQYIVYGQFVATHLRCIYNVEEFIDNYIKQLFPEKHLATENKNIVTPNEDSFIIDNSNKEETEQKVTLNEDTIIVENSNKEKTEQKVSPNEDFIIVDNSNEEETEQAELDNNSEQNKQPDTEEPVQEVHKGSSQNKVFAFTLNLLSEGKKDFFKALIKSGLIKPDFEQDKTIAKLEIAFGGKKIDVEKGIELIQKEITVPQNIEWIAKYSKDKLHVACLRYLFKRLFDSGICINDGKIRHIRLAQIFCGANEKKLGLRQSKSETDITTINPEESMNPIAKKNYNAVEQIITDFINRIDNKSTESLKNIKISKEISILPLNIPKF